MYPYLSIGANFHHERCDGTGYPNKLKGTDIPEIARIISVADAYDAMTSSRSYRDPIPQQNVREEYNKNGYDCEIVFERDGNKIVAVTDNAGISIKSTTDIKVPVDKICVALSGDQCAITNIRIYS